MKMERTAWNHTRGLLTASPTFIGHCAFEVRYRV